MKITIDRDRCMGSGNCAAYAPETFDLDDDLKVIVLDPDGNAEEDIRAAVDGCPTKALTIVEED